MSKKMYFVLFLGLTLVLFAGFMIIKNSISFSKFLDEKYSDNDSKVTSNKNNKRKEKDIDLIIKINGYDIPAKLFYAETGLEFMSKLPLEITMDDLNRNEKYYYFDEAFITDSSVITNIKKGDLMIYSNNCFVIFYKNHKNITYSYTKLGEITDLDLLNKAIKSGESQKVVIELA